MVKDTEQVASLSPTVRLGGAAIDRKVVSGIRAASDRTGVDFRFMLAKARHESDFQTDARNLRSSAQGLYQFTDQTWMEQIKRHGARYGLAHLSDRLSPRPGGGYQADSPEALREILALRRDPAVSAAMAAEYTSQNSTYLERRLGRPAGETDLYMAHFLGPGGAVNFLRAMESTPAASAAAAFPRAAGANRTVFFTPEGVPRSFAEVYEVLDASISSAMSRFGAGSGTAQAQAQAVRWAPPSGLSPNGLDGHSDAPVPVAPVMPQAVRDRRTIAAVVSRYREMMNARPALPSDGMARAGDPVRQAGIRPEPLPGRKAGPAAVPLEAPASGSAAVTAADRSVRAASVSDSGSGFGSGSGEGFVPWPSARRPEAEDMGQGARVFASREGVPFPIAPKPGPEDMALSRDPGAPAATVRPVAPAQGIRLEMASGAGPIPGGLPGMVAADMPSSHVMESAARQYARLVDSVPGEAPRGLADRLVPEDAGTRSTLNTRPGSVDAPSVQAVEETFRPDARVTEIRRRLPPVVSERALGSLSKEERRALFGQVVERPAPPGSDAASVPAGEGEVSPSGGVMAWIRRIRGDGSSGPPA
ncbi:transglycosylase SLT domain-containing protein [Phaeovibrio sulfidiphilus]|uniref:Transglycosylase SLT domain-containing protein n=1 Tax=Phaeovibrio sulfidiphilus TaxID=1220600 RepID=A0A8J6YL51_9PROT|nr:transglycosylase SLT domain-containing protein [Phaeovibrio sulfidiphilus]MBE1236700.1 transglycosylase SLT domain-containing protein [Phaeovibrio sulfidiphilus]